MRPSGLRTTIRSVAWSHPERSYPTVNSAELLRLITCQTGNVLINNYKIDNNLTIEDCIKYFKKNYQTEKGITDSTLSSYNKSLNDFQGCFSYIRRFNELTRNNYAELVNYLKNKYCSTTINIRLRSIRTFLNYLYENEKI